MSPDYNSRVRRPDKPDANPDVLTPASSSMDSGTRSYYGESDAPVSPHSMGGGFDYAAPPMQKVDDGMRQSHMPPAQPQQPQPQQPAAPVVNAWGAANDQWRQSQGMAPQNPAPAPVQPAAPAPTQQPAQQQPQQAQSFAPAGGGMQSGAHMQSPPISLGYQSQQQPTGVAPGQHSHQMQQPQRPPQQRPQTMQGSPRRNYYGG